MNEHRAFLRRSGAQRVALWAVVLLALTAFVRLSLYAQISEADKKKRDAFLKAREEMHTVATPTPSESPSPSGKPKTAKKKSKAAKSPTPSASDNPKRAKAVAADDDDDDATPATTKKKKNASPSPKATGQPKKATAADEDDEQQTAPRPTSVPRPPPVSEQTAPPRSVPNSTVFNAQTVPPVPADITVQKSGFEQEQGFEPAPPPPPRRSFWARLFGGGDDRNYRYLNRSVIEAIRRAPVQRSRWKFVIVHNSGTRQGNARAFDYYHRHVKRMQNGMAYHFVVGNGRSSGDGEIEVGDRWRRQINGGHVHSDYLNNISLGICLVGDFNRDTPTRAQLEATEELIKYLRERCGRMPVRPHREMNPPQWATDCPGDAFPYVWFRRF